jgi:hypothetical protein
MHAIIPVVCVSLTQFKAWVKGVFKRKLQFLNGFNLVKEESVC